MKTFDGLSTCNKWSVNLSVLEIDSTNNSVPWSCNQEIKLLMNTCVIDWVLEFENSCARIVLQIPLTYSAVLWCAKETSVFICKVIDFVYVPNQRSQLINSVCLLVELIRIDFPVTNKSIAITWKHLNHGWAIEAVCRELGVSSYFFKCLWRIEHMALSVVHKFADFFFEWVKFLLCWLKNLDHRQNFALLKSPNFQS